MWLCILHNVPLMILCFDLVAPEVLAGILGVSPGWRGDRADVTGFGRCRSLLVHPELLAGILGVSLGWRRVATEPMLLDSVGVARC